MSAPLLGLHHVTAIVDEPQENVDFWTRVLGLRLVKQTVNFDDPSTYHLYYGDDAGRPGTVITFFPWPGRHRGSRGTGQISAIALRVPAGSLSFWQAHLAAHACHFSDPEDRFGTRVVSFYDPAGLLIELVEQPSAAVRTRHQYPDIPAEAAIDGLFGVTLTVAQAAASAAVLTDLLGFHAAGDQPYQRYAVGTEPDRAVVSLISRPDVPRGQIAAGSVHHVAWRVVDDTALDAWRRALTQRGLQVTPVRNRQYFRSIYFREPGGVLFELATDGPGFAVDEPLADLGTHLMLPPWLEPRRNDLAAHLPPLVVPRGPSRELSSGATRHGRPNQPADTAPALGFTHQFIPAETMDAPTLLLLHGTGGTEYDLLDLGRRLYPGAALLSPRGPVLENGMPRFFRRLAEGIFDVDDLRQRTHDLADFVTAACDRYSVDRRRVLAVGYSNGANIAASVLLLRPATLAGAVLFHAMVPLVPAPLPELRGLPVFVSAGRTDPLISIQQTEALAALLRQSGAQIELHWEPDGHSLAPSEVDAAKLWLATYVAGRMRSSSQPQA